MRRLRSTLSAIAHAAILTTVATHVVLAASPHVLCAAARHDCGSTARIVACCCDENTDASRASGPIVPAVRVAPTLAAAPAVHQIARPATRPSPTEGATTSALPGDLTILRANLRV